ncbi:MAG: hypothetical protein P8Y62_07985 [candidate division WOR-3 bacterium]|jgi:hypothetical protein
MNIAKDSLNLLKIKILIFLSCLSLVCSVYAVPFEVSRTVEKGEGELMFGCSSMLNLTFKGSFSVAEYLSLGFGIDLPFVNMCLTGRREFFSFGKEPYLNLSLCGAYGITGTDIPYYHYTLLAGLNYKEGESFTFGVGMIQDPRFEFNPFETGPSSPQEAGGRFHILLGRSDSRFIKQLQFVFDPSDRDDKVRVVFGFGVRSIRLLV